MGIIQSTLDKVSNATETYAETIFKSFGSDIRAAFIAAMTVSLVLIGFNLFYQWRAQSWADAVNWSIRVFIAFVLATSFTAFTPILNFVTEAPVDVAGHFVATATGQETASLYATMDGVIDKILEAGNKISENGSWVIGPIAYALFVIIAVVFGAVVIFVSVYAKVMTAFYLGLAPLAILATMFAATKDFFSKWLNGLTAAMLIPIVAAGVMAIITGILSDETGRTNIDSDTIIGDLVGYGMIVVVAIIMLSQIIPIANNLAGTINLGGYSAGRAAGLAVGAGNAATLGVAGAAARTGQAVASSGVQTVKTTAAATATAGGAAAMAKINRALMRMKR